MRNVADLGQPDRGTGAGVHFFDGHAQFAHQAQRVEDGKSADAVGDEIRRVFGDDHAFAEAAVAEFRERVENFGGSFRPGDQFDQFQIARRVEEMSAGPVLLEFLAHAFGDQVNRQSGGIGGDDGSGLAELGHAREQAALDLEIFGDHFDDPVGVFAARQVVFEIADGDFIG